MQTRLFIGAILLGAAAVASAQKVTLRYNPPAGKTYTYRMTNESSSTSPMGAQQLKQTATVAMKVVQNKGGKLTLSTSMSNLDITVPKGSPLEAQVPQMEKAMAIKDVKMTIDNRGRPVTVDGKNADPMMQAMMAGLQSGTMMSVYPAEPVGVGSTWSTTFDMAKMMGSMMPGMKTTGGKMPIKMKLVRFVNRGSQRLAEITIDMRGSMSMQNPGGSQGTATMSMTSTGKMLVDVKTGIPVETTNSGTSTSKFGQMTMKQTTKSTMKLVG